MERQKYKSLAELPEMITVQEAADYCRISKSKMYEMAKAKGFPRLRLRGRLVIPRDKFRDWLDNLMKMGA